MNRWNQILGEVDPVAVREQRENLDSESISGGTLKDETLVSFVALIERLRDEVAGKYPPKFLAESTIWGDSTVSIQLSTDDYERRQAALAWALVEILPEAQNSRRVRDAVKCVERFGASDEPPEHAEAFRALLNVLGAAPRKVAGVAWRFFAEHALDSIEEGVATRAEVRRILSLGHRGHTKKIVAPVLEALGGPLDDEKPTKK